MPEKENNLLNEIKDITNKFEHKPYTENVRLLRKDFEVKSIKTPSHYKSIIGEIEEVLREARLLFLYSVFDNVCKEESEWFIFDTPYQANMAYDAVMKKDGDFYIRDEDGDHRGIFTSEQFVTFVDELYWELYE